MRKIKISSFLLLCTFSFLVSAAQWDQEKFDAYLDIIEKNDKAMLSISMLEGDKVIYARAIGLVDAKSKEKVNPDLKYRIGSITKIYTAVMIMQLVEQKKLSLDTKLSSFYPDVINADKITVKHLLGHRSGIENFTNRPNYMTYNTHEKSKAELLEIIQDMTARFEPDAKYEYSNSGYVLLGMIVEKLDKTSFAESLKTRILEPLKLKNTLYNQAIDTSSGQVNSMIFQAGNWMNMSETHMSIPAGAGAITSTATDVSRFLTSLFDFKLVSEESVKLMTTINEGYGLGIIQVPFYDRYSFGHTGGIDAFITISTHFPKDDLTITLLSNGLKMNMNDISIALLSAYFGRPFELPEFSNVTIELDASQLEQFVGYYKSDNFPLDIDVTLNDGNLFAQATGQGAFPLTPVTENKFVYEQAGIEMTFNGDSGPNTLVLKQGGQATVFKK